MHVTTIEPAFGFNYNIGYVGFTWTPRDIVANGIAWFTRRDALSEIRVCHVLVVSGPGTCIESTGRTGVVETSMAKYFNDPNKLIFFREPQCYSSAMGKAIVERARQHVGRGYDFRLIAGLAIANSMVGQAISRVVPALEERVARRWNTPGRDICVEPVVDALNTQPAIRGRGTLAKPTYAINPQELFEDDVVFSPWGTR